MKLIEKVLAYRAICEMMKEEWEFSFIYPLVCLMAELARDYEFFTLEEMKLVSRYGKKEADGTVAVDHSGSFSFADTDDASAYAAAHRKLEQLDTAAPQKIPLVCPDHIRGEWLRALLPLCDFQKAGDAHGQIA